MFQPYFYLLCVSVLISQIQNQLNKKAEDYMKVIKKKECLKYWPNKGTIKYGNSFIENTPGIIDHCQQYQERTCCDRNNFEMVKKQILILHQSELSKECKAELQKLVCMPCLAEVGIGLVQGLCSSTCNHLYSVCQMDYFQLDEQSLQLRPCQIDSLVCAQLNSIYRNANGLCQALNIPINSVNNHSLSITNIISFVVDQPDTITTPQCYQNIQYETLFSKFIDRPIYAPSQNVLTNQQMIFKMIKDLAIVSLICLIVFMIYSYNQQDKQLEQANQYMVIGTGQSSEDMNTYEYENMGAEQREYISNRKKQQQGEVAMSADYNEIKLVDSSEFYQNHTSIRNNNQPKEFDVNRFNYQSEANDKQQFT